MFELLTDNLLIRRRRLLSLVGAGAALFLLSGFEHRELLESAEVGDPSAQYKLGYYFYRRENPEYDPEKAVHWFSKAAENDDLRALVVVSRFYRDGRVVEKDTEKASLYRKRVIDAAGKKEPTTEFPTKEDYFAYLFMPWGRDKIEEDYKEELFWRRRAAEKGSGFSQWRIGGFAEFGKGVKKDSKLAVDWYRKAGRGGLDVARESFCRLAPTVDFLYLDDPQYAQWCK